jgi:hypothetical protein
MRLSLAENVEKSLMSLYGTEWRERGYDGLMYHRGVNELEANARLLFGSHETSPIIWKGKAAPAIQC